MKLNQKVRKLLIGKYCKKALQILQVTKKLNHTILNELSIIRVKIARKIFLQKSSKQNFWK